jgi:hypothetical protein
MDSQQINDIARRLTQQWITLLRSRMSNNSNIHGRSFLNHLEANGNIVLKYEDQQLLVSENQKLSSANRKISHPNL